MEMYGQKPNSLLMTAHTNQTGQHTTVGSTVNVMDTAGFHTYGLLWTPDKLIWTYDGVQVAAAATPSDMNKPMYMLVDLAVGGQAGAPPDHLATPAQMKIDYIHAYTLNDLPSQAAALTSHTASSTTSEHTV
jgi:beta-glucanase (GH16 family)